MRRAFHHATKHNYNAVVITDPLVQYESHVRRGIIQEDEHQWRAAIELQKLSRRVLNYTPHADIDHRFESLKQILAVGGTRHIEISANSLQKNRKSILPGFNRDAKSLSLVRSLSNEDEVAQLSTPQGVFLSGEVGSGKSMLMDMFFDTVAVQKKRRMHHHAFSLYLYELIHRERLNSPKQTMLSREFSLLTIARSLINHVTVLGIDEFQLPDPALAAMIKHIFLYYFKFGGVLVATSNRLPTDLYARDFRKSQYDSFIDILQRRCIFHDMRSSRDYRKLDGMPLYYYTDISSAWDDQIERLLGQKPQTKTISVYSRALTLKSTNEGVALFTFDELCGNDTCLGPADFLSIASIFHTIIINHVPVLTLSRKNEARRFISLLDAMYESKTNLLIHAAVPPDGLLFPDAEQTKLSGRVEDAQEALWRESYTKAALDLSAPYRPNISSYESSHSESTTTQSDRALEIGHLSAFTGEDEKFAFKRAVSRLYELPTEAWWSKPHVGISHRFWESPSLHEPSERSQPELQNTVNPFRQSESEPPRFSSNHFWSLARWGKRAGRWGQGADAAAQRRE